MKIILALVLALSAPAAALAGPVEDLLGGTRKECRGCDLTDANFKKAHLSDVDFTGATLTNANFHRAILDGAIFDGVQAAGANFNLAGLSGASFLDAHLNGALFYEAQLSGAHFDRGLRARLTATRLWRSLMRSSVTMRTPRTIPAASMSTEMMTGWA